MNSIGRIKRALRKPSLITNRLKVELIRRNISIPGLRAPLPAVVYIAPTLKCNLSCRTCGLGNNMSIPERTPPSTHFSDEMNWNEWCCLLDQLGCFKPRVLLSGGEPLLSPHTIPIVDRLAHRFDMHVAIGTNGLCLEEQGEDLFRAGVSHLYISIDGVGDVYESIRGKGHFNKLEKSLETLQRLRRSYAANAPEVNAIVVMTPQVVPHLKETMEYLMAFGIRRFSFQHFFQFTESNLAAVTTQTKDPRQNPRWTWGEQIDLSGWDPIVLSTAIDELRQISVSRQDVHIEFVPDFDPPGFNNYYRNRPMTEVPGFKCPLFRIGTYIYPDGSVIPAHFCHYYSVGNVRSTPFRDLWHGAEYTWIRQTVAREGWLPMCGYCMIPYGACI